MSVSKRLRFEILRRDQSTCRYCGATAPDVAVTIDHVIPVALGGTDDPTNLVTACAACNSGKTSTSPDAPLVADVERAALVWARALSVAVDRRAAARQESSDLLTYFEDEWLFRYEVAAPLEDDWRPSVLRFVDHGLSVADLDEAIDVAYAARIRSASRWRYFCGTCWRMVAELHDDAQHIIETGGARDGA